MAEFMVLINVVLLILLVLAYRIRHINPDLGDSQRIFRLILFLFLTDLTHFIITETSRFWGNNNSNNTNTNNSNTTNEEEDDDPAVVVGSSSRSLATNKFHLLSLLFLLKLFVDSVGILS